MVVSSGRPQWFVKTNAALAQAEHQRRLLERSVPSETMKQLERLLFLQGDRCFFCEQPIPLGEASVEHLVASANGGLNEDNNCVVCCKAVNAALGSLSVKAKLRAVLNQRGAFKCPSRSQLATATAPQEAGKGVVADRISLVVADLQKRGAARPRRVVTLKNTIASVFQKQLSEVELSDLVEALEKRKFIVVDETKITYALPQPGA
jgi:hypothetical protein